MAPVTYKVKLTRPQVFLWRMSLFLILAILLAIILDGQTQQLRHSFMANPGLNALIIGVLVSMFSAIVVTRTILRWVVAQSWSRKASLYGVSEEEFVAAGLPARARLRGEARSRV